MSANPSVVMRSAAPSAAPAPCTPWAIATSCSRDHRPSSTPSNSASKFRYAAPQPPRLLHLDTAALWFSAAGVPPVAVATDRRKVELADVQQALTELGAQARYNQLRQHIMTLTECSKRTAQMAIATACQQGWIVQADGQYCLPD